MDTTAFVWLIVLPLVASPVIYLVGRLAVRNSRLISQNRAAYGAGVLALGVTWIPFVLSVRELSASGPITYTVGMVSLRLDGLSLLLSAMALTLGTLVILYSGPSLADEIGQEKYYAMLSAMVGAMIGLACAADLFNLWIWFETMAVSSYLLVAFYREERASLEAGVKYLVQSAAGSVMVLLGIALVLAQTGTVNLDEIREALAAGPAARALWAAGALFIIGFGVKTALVPLHTWLPDAHAQAPSGISAMLSGIVIEAGLVAMLRSLVALGLSSLAVGIPWGALLMGFGALNMLVGNLLALRQTQVKRLLAFSSISHVGYMLVGIGIGLYAGQVAGVQGGFFHLLTHGLMKGLAFLAAGALLYALHLSRKQVEGEVESRPLTLSDLSGAAQRYPLTALALSVAVLGLGGLPPLAGFMSKWQIFVAGFATHNVLIGLLVVFAALNSVLSLAYYVPLVNAVYRRQPSESVLQGQPLSMVMQVPLVLLALGVVAIGVWPSLVDWLTEPAGLTVLAALER
jgi:proton-translocating NADH-quinone oxidoreductase chain N